MMMEYLCTRCSFGNQRKSSYGEKKVEQHRTGWMRLKPIPYLKVNLFWQIEKEVEWVDE